MSDHNDDAGSLLGSWPGGMTGTDAELLLRAGSVMELGTGLHHLAVMAERYVADHDRLAPAGIADGSLSAQAVQADVRERVARQLGEFTDTYKRRVQDRLDQLDLDDITAQTSDPFELMAGLLHGPMQATIEDARAVLGELPASDAALLSYLMQYSQAVDRKPLLPTMRRALLITAVASAETMLTGVLRRILYNHDGAARWGPLWDTPELNKEIGRRTRGSIEDWVPREFTALGVDVPAAWCDWPAVLEVWARRNVLVHHNGLADKQYARRVPGAAQGSVLEVDGEYLRTAIDVLCGLLLGVILVTWGGQPGRSSFVMQLAAVYAASAVAERRWPLAESLYAVSAQVEIEREDAATSQVNAWLARIQRRGPESVLADVTNWQVDGLPQRFTLARMILLGNADESIAMLPELVSNGELTKENLRDWPLFDVLRDNPAFQQVLAV
jgi:hypothetical protein